MNLRSSRERHFLDDFHGHFFGFTGTSCRKFTGQQLRSLAIFWTFSRALFVVHGSHFLKLFMGTFRYSRALFAQSTKLDRNWAFMGSFRRFTGTFLLKMFTGNFETIGHFFSVHGTFLGSRANSLPNVHGHIQNIHVHFCENSHGKFFEVHGKKY